MCFYCKGDLKDDFTTHVVDLNHSIIIIRNVPCMKCEQCGEVVYSGSTVQRLEEVTELLKTSLTEVAIINYGDKIA